jgi:hypothetical protein
MGVCAVLADASVHRNHGIGSRLDATGWRPPNAALHRRCAECLHLERQPIMRTCNRQCPRSDGMCLSTPRVWVSRGHVDLRRALVSAVRQRSPRWRCRRTQVVDRWRGHRRNRGRADHRRVFCSSAASCIAPCSVTAAAARCSTPPCSATPLGRPWQRCWPPPRCTCCW